MNQKTDYITEYITDLEVSEGFVSPSGGRPTIFKKVLTGYAVIKKLAPAGASLIRSEPLYQTDIEEDIEEFGIELQSDEQLITVTPLAKLTFGVFALFPESSTTFEAFETDSYSLDSPVFLGFEFEHIEHSKWISVYKQRLLKMFNVPRTLFNV